MKIATQAIQYYCTVTGKSYDDFFINLESAKLHPEDSDELWLINKLFKTIVDNGITEHDLLSNKDVIRGVLDTESRKNEGEFYTPEVWCKEGRKYFDKYIGDSWHDYNVWDASCYTMDTKIFTQRGWVYYPNLRDDDKVLSLNPQTLSLEWVGFHRRIVKETHTLINFYNKEDILAIPNYDNNGYTCYKGMYEGYDKSKILSVTPDHAMWVDVGNGLQKIKAGDLYKNIKKYNQIKIPTACHRIGDFRRCNGINIDKYILGNELILNKKDALYDYPFLISSDTDCLSHGWYVIRRKDYTKRNAVTKSYSKEPIKVWDITLNKNHVFLVCRGRTNHPVFSGNCGMGNLMRTANHRQDKLFLSTLREQDAKAVQQTFKDATVFPLDFLFKIDYDDSNMDFFNQLPQRLKDIFINDEPLIFYMNPPYKVGKIANTDVASYMTGLGFERACYDIYYQFLWRVMNLVERFKLSNCYFSCFGPQVYFTGSQSRPLLKEFEHVFEYVDGMCISAKEFSDTSKDVLWGVCCSFWKSRGGYVQDIEVKPKLFDRMILNPDGIPVTQGTVLLEPPRVQLSEWVKPDDIMGYITAPVMTSHSIFRGENNSTQPTLGMKMAENSMGVTMRDDTLNYINERCGMLSVPTTLPYWDITTENFWRVVGAYAFKVCYETDWSTARMRASAPNVNSEGYTEWLHSSIVMFLFGRKSHFSAWRNINFKGEPIDIENYFFPVSQDEIKSICTDQVILNDIATHKPVNKFFLEQLEIAKADWCKEAQDLFNFGVDTIKKFINCRDEVNYENGLDAWNASMLQVRVKFWSEELEAEYSKYYTALRKKLAEPLERFGFVVALDMDDNN